MTLSWSGGGGAGASTKHVRAWFTRLDERGNQIVIRYDHENGQMDLSMRQRSDNRWELIGRWSQRGSGGKIYMLVNSRRESGTGYWTYDGSDTHYDLSLRTGGPGCAAPPPPPPPPDPSCGIARGAEVYPGCGYVYQSRANRRKQCGANDAPLKFIYNDRTKSSCGIRREQTVYSGCGYVYQREADWRAQCGQDSGRFKFIPRE